MADVKEYESRLRALQPGEPVTLVIRRGRKILTTELVDTETSKPEGKP